MNKLSSLFAYHLQAATQSIHALLSRPLATSMTVLVIAVALTLPTLFWVFTNNVSTLMEQWQRNGHISLYLQPSITTEKTEQLLTQVKAIPGVANIKLITPQDSLDDIQQQEGMQDIMQYLPNNPFPFVIEVTPTLARQSATSLKLLLQELSALPFVEQSKLDTQWVTRLHSLLHLASTLAKALVLLLATGVILIIGNALGLAVHHQKEEIQVLKLIGATDAFILRPFLYTGLWYGLGGAIFAILLVNIFMLSIAMALQEVGEAYHLTLPFYGLSVKQAYTILMIALLLGWIGAKLSIKRQITFIEPYS